MEVRDRFTRLVLTLGVIAALVTAVGCYEEPIAITTFPPERTPRATTVPPSIKLPTPSSSSATPTPTRPPATQTPIVLTTPSPPPPTVSPTPLSTFEPAGGPPSPGCVDGWLSPAPGTPEFNEGLAILEGHMGIQGPWTVTEMRYFTGPEVSWILSNPNRVERWYVRAALVADPSFGGRWLVEKRSDDVMGVAAVAPWESFGYESPDWTGFVGEGEPQTYIGLPGQWSGSPYDFVTGEGYSGNPGLPDEVVDCLLAT